MMKSIKIFLIAFLFFASGCEKYIDKSDQIPLDEQDIFGRYEGVRGYLDNCYRALLDVFAWDSQSMARTYIAGISDEAGTLYSNPMNTVINLGDWLNRRTVGEIGFNTTDAVDVGKEQAPLMDNAYFCLRIANKVIAQAAEVPGITSQQLDELLGQAYFMRGWYYFQLIQRVGGLPLYDRAYAADDDLDLPRLTYAESNEFVIANMDEAISRLPHKWDVNNTGRATKAAAMAVKEMAMLYAASPLMQNDLNSTVNKGYGVAQAERAAEYANDLIKYTQTNTGGTNYRMLPGAEYKNIFYHSPKNYSDEQLWYNMDAGLRNQERGLRVHFITQFLSGGTGVDAAPFTGPTQNIVDKFEKVVGAAAYPIDDPRAQYDPQNPYANRDPRLANNIVVPGEAWGSTANNSQAYQELYVGGRDLRNAETNNATRNRLATGYLAKKFVWPSANTFNAQYTIFRVNTCYIRLAQVYLDYAEAMNEAYGPTADPKGYGLTAAAAINIVRNRAGMPDVLSEFTGSKEALRGRIRNERAVELFFENHRWHDLRRWMIAEEVFRTPIRGIRATPPANHASVANKSTLKFNYNVIDLVTEQRIFQTKHYWYPVDQVQVNDQYNFKQNPGW
jgi:hypothetical protein